MVTITNYNCIIILGPTASGKTKLSVEIAKALNTEIINADSMQIYKELNIGTAKPTKEEMQNIKHHLMDIVKPTEGYSVNEFKKVATDLILDLNKNNKIPVIVGGTGFYIEALLKDYSYGNSFKNEEIRTKYHNLAIKHGNEYIYKILQEKDEETAQKLHFNDVTRVIRALEIFEVSGLKKSEIEKNNSTMQTSNIRPIIIGLNMPREMLYERINQRVDIMLNNGLLSEVQFLYNLDYTAELQSMRGIGYKELFEYLNKQKTLGECVDKIKQASRNYAKRQLTWFGHMENINWFDVSKTTVETIIEFVLEKLNK